jgi:hypothetical protein
VPENGFYLAYETSCHEDSDHRFKLHALERKVLFCPNAVVVHTGERSGE